MVAVDRVFKQFRTSFLGKSSPVHLFWGSFDLAVTRFSGRPAPLHPGGMPALPDAVAQEAYDHEVPRPVSGPVAAGSTMRRSMPTPIRRRMDTQTPRARPEAAFWHPDLGEFVLPYEAVRSAPDPEATLLQFLESTYESAAELGGWDRAALECRPAAPLAPRPVRKAGAS